MVEFDAKFSSGMQSEKYIKQAVSTVNLPENLPVQNAADAMAYALAHTFKRAGSLDDVLFDLNYIIKQLSCVRDNINPF